MKNDARNISQWTRIRRYTWKFLVLLLLWRTKVSYEYFTLSWILHLVLKLRLFIGLAFTSSSPRPYRNLGFCGSRTYKVSLWSERHILLFWKYRCMLYSFKILRPLATRKYKLVNWTLAFRVRNPVFRFREIRTESCPNLGATNVGLSNLHFRIPRDM